MKALKRDYLKPTLEKRGSDRFEKREALAETKRRVLRDYSEAVGEHTSLLRLALNEAEALAWDTGYPHLFFPTLALEKAESTVQWHRQQRAVRRKAAEIAFAE